MKPRCVIFDLDGTLCELKKYPDTNKHTGEELPIYSTIEELWDEWSMLSVDIFIVTGRKRKPYEKCTTEWLYKWNIPYEKLYMQEGSVAVKNHIYKRKVFEEIQKTHTIAMVYDDNPELAIVCKDLGIKFNQILPE